LGSLVVLALLQSVAKVEILQGNYKGFTKQDGKKTLLAHKAQVMVGSPSDHHFAELMSDNGNALKIISVPWSRYFPFPSGTISPRI